jgi:hypothetical protein
MIRTEDTRVKMSVAAQVLSTYVSTSRSVCNIINLRGASLVLGALVRASAAWSTSIDLCHIFLQKK